MREKTNNLYKEKEKEKEKKTQDNRKKFFFSIRVRWINCSPKTKTLFILFIIVPE